MFFFNFLLFWSFPEVEGPHSDTLSRTRFSVFLRISFGVSSSSIDSSNGREKENLNRGISSQVCARAGSRGNQFRPVVDIFNLPLKREVEFAKCRGS